MEQKKTHPSGEYDPEFFNTNAFVKEEQSLPTTNPPILLPPTASGPVHMSPASTSETQQRPLMNTTLFMSSFAGTITAGVVLGVIVLIVYVVRRKCRAHKYFNGYKKLSGTNSPGEQQSRGKDVVFQHSYVATFPFLGAVRETSSFFGSTVIVHELSLNLSLVGALGET